MEGRERERMGSEGRQETVKGSIEVEAVDGGDEVGGRGGEITSGLQKATEVDEGPGVGMGDVLEVERAGVCRGVGNVAGETSLGLG